MVPKHCSCCAARGSIINVQRKDYIFALFSCPNVNSKYCFEAMALDDELLNWGSWVQFQLRSKVAWLCHKCVLPWSLPVLVSPSCAKTSDVIKQTQPPTLCLVAHFMNSITALITDPHAAQQIVYNVWLNHICQNFLSAENSFRHKLNGILIKSWTDESTNAFLYFQCDWSLLMMRWSFGYSSGSSQTSWGIAIEFSKDLDNYIDLAEYGDMLDECGWTVPDKLTDKVN